MYGQRLLLEPLAIHVSVPRLTRDDLAEVKGALDGSNAALRANDMDRFHEHHRVLHLGLVRRVGPRLFRTISELWDHAERYRRVFLVGGVVDRRQQTICDHEELVAAAFARDTARCATVLIRHLSTTALTVFDYYGGPERPELINLVLETHR